LVRSIGADHVIDYTQQDFTQNGQQYDLVFDMIANYSVKQARRTLTPQGQYVLGGFSTLPHLIGFALGGKWVSKANGQQVGMMGTAETNKQDMLTLKAMLERGQIKSVIDRCYPLAQTAEAIAYLETSRARGKVIIQIS
jgi:NADPH:quinone reductase-like Zn-dependent oxidoreductase